ncbi:hypothetical protein CR532_04850 (plasmid) [Candidatus Borreliella tachyglossi]|uniref:Uncharacterized protein n=1 Tax=Candidatus Borreliella tachyglossi TaxID=1964448 RepID=A0A2S1LYF2_9SPIR|nr:hypothetical protein [Candidatus Borreliella tachyglossi]AWG43328.1 hypothetical protein CR532_04850 [Candidatus Borreliella tachyglossi]
MENNQFDNFDDVKIKDIKTGKVRNILIMGQGAVYVLVYIVIWSSICAVFYFWEMSGHKRQEVQVWHETKLHVPKNQNKSK